MGDASRRKKALMVGATHLSTESNPEKVTKRKPREQTPYTGSHRQPSGHDDPLKFIGQLTNVFVNFPLMYEEADKEVQRLDLEYGDLTHAIELSEVKGRQASAIVKNLKANRKKRREAKDFMKLSIGLYNFIKPRTAMVPELQRLHGDMHKLKDALGRQTYTPRVLGSMEEAFERVGLTKREAELRADGLDVIAEASEGGRG